MRSRRVTLCADCWSNIWPGHYRVALIVLMESTLTFAVGGGPIDIALWLVNWEVPATTEQERKAEIFVEVAP